MMQDYILTVKSYLYAMTKICFHQTFFFSCLELICIWLKVFYAFTGKDYSRWIAFLNKTKQKAHEYCQNSGFKYISFYSVHHSRDFLINATLASTDTLAAKLGQSSSPAAADDRQQSLIATAAFTWTRNYLLWGTVRATDPQHLNWKMV